MKKFDYSGLIKTIGEIKTSEIKMLNEELFSQKQHLADLENKVNTNGILEDWAELKHTCKQVGVRLCPHGGYNSVVNKNEEKIGTLIKGSCFRDNGCFSDNIQGNYYGFTFRNGNVVWGWFEKCNLYCSCKFETEGQEVVHKIKLLQNFLDTYEEYREVQLQRVIWAMGELAENVAKIRERIE